jgi:hypothetical protein
VAAFPKARKITVAGTSAGGVGADGFAPFLVRFLYGNRVSLTVLNDAGPVVINPDDVVGIQARAADWQFGQFYPSSCPTCSDMGAATEVIKWRLENDTTVREAWYETDGDGTNRFFLSVPTQAEYRDLILAETDPIHAAFPLRYRRFIKSGDDTHTALQNTRLDTQVIQGVVLKGWVEDFLRYNLFGWRDLVEDFVPLP